MNEHSTYGDLEVAESNGILRNEALHAAGAVLDAEGGAVGHIGVGELVVVLVVELASHVA